MQGADSRLKYGYHQSATLDNKLPGIAYKNMGEQLLTGAKMTQDICVTKSLL